ncbi:hypothetical protein CLU79DRAFT_329093 [Phycomyces nitens]|nr:hypothetical protein CLU79DRAFT_329093 [Phycomyces nitens]
MKSHPPHLPAIPPSVWPGQIKTSLSDLTSICLNSRLCRNSRRRSVGCACGIPFRKIRSLFCNPINPSDFITTIGSLISKNTYCPGPPRLLAHLACFPFSAKQRVARSFKHYLISQIHPLFFYWFWFFLVFDFVPGLFFTPEDEYLTICFGSVQLRIGSIGRPGRTEIQWLRHLSDPIQERRESRFRSRNAGPFCTTQEILVHLSSSSCLFVTNCFRSCPRPKPRFEMVTLGVKQVVL